MTKPTLDCYTKFAVDRFQSTFGAKSFGYMDASEKYWVKEAQYIKQLK